MSGKTLNLLALSLLILIWGTTWAVIRVGLEGIPPFLGVSLRFSLASVILIVAGKIAGVRLGHGRREWLMWAVNGLLAFSVSYGVVYWAEQWIPSGLAAVLFATFPLFVAGFAHFWLPGEQLRSKSILGICVGFFGVMVIYSEDLTELAGAEARVASLIFLISPLVAAAANVIVKRWGSGIHPLSLTAVPMGLTGILMGAMAALFERGESVTFDSVSVGALLYLAILGTSVTFLIFFWLLQRLPATRLSLITYGVPVVAVIVGTLFLDEPLSARIIGFFRLYKYSDFSSRLNRIYLFDTLET